MLVQVITHPPFDNEPYAHGWRVYAWALNEALLLACLAAGGGLFNSRQLRALIDDDVARSNNLKACKLGFWVAMLTGLVLYSLPRLAELSGRQAIYLISTAGASSALLAFSWLEHRSHADA